MEESKIIKILSLLGMVYLIFLYKCANLDLKGSCDASCETMHASCTSYEITDYKYYVIPIVKNNCVKNKSEPRLRRP